MRLTGDAASLVDCAAAVRTGERSPLELVEQALTRVAEVDPELSAFVAMSANRARAEAAVLTAEARSGRLRGSFHGVPVAVKDLFDVAGEVTGAGSRLPPTGRPAQADATAVAALRAAGAVVLGRTRTHEYAWGLTTQHEVLGGTRNPHETSRVPGGSSGGSAAAVAAGVVPAALGTDTAGSIRLPAAWCGLVGHKPTHGWVDLTGVVPLAPSFDHAGALVRTVADARLALEVLSGRRIPAGGRPLPTLRLGLPVDPCEPPCDPEVRRVVDAVATAARAAGVRVHELPVPSSAELRAVFSIVQADEALGYHRSLGHWPARAELYGADVRGRMTMGDDVAADDVRRARVRLEELRADALRLFDRVDVLLQPVAGSGPSRVEDPNTLQVDGSPVDLRDAVLPYTLLASVCGLPACSIPVGVDRDGLPVGLQVIGRRGADALVLDVAEQFVAVSAGHSTG